MRNKNIVMTRQQIEQNAWDFDFEGGSNVIDVYIRYLRKKIDAQYEQKTHPHCSRCRICNEGKRMKQLTIKKKNYAMVHRNHCRSSWDYFSSRPSFCG